MRRGEKTDRMGASFGIAEGILWRDRPAAEKALFWNACHPAEDGSVVTRLRALGYTPTALLRQDPFLAVDPHRLELACGEAVSAGKVSFALGVDTGGSLLRQASAGATVVRLQASALPRDGMIFSAPSFQAWGLVAPDRATVRHLTEGLLEPIDPHFDLENGAVETLGADFPTNTAFDTYRILSAVELSSELGLYDGIRFGVNERSGGSAREQMEAYRGRCFSAELKTLLLLGTALLLPPYREGCYARALANRSILMDEMRKRLARVGAIRCPLNRETAVLPSLLDLFAVALNGELLMTLDGRERWLLSLLDESNGEGGARE